MKRKLKNAKICNRSTSKKSQGDAIEGVHKT
jgi:hypothetical protein